MVDPGIATSVLPPLRTSSNIPRALLRLCFQKVKLIFSICFVLSAVFPINQRNQRTIGPVNAHLISWPSKAQNIQNLENIW